MAIHADQLLARGHEVTVVARGKKHPSKSERLRRLIQHGFGNQSPAGSSHFSRMKSPLTILPHPGPITEKDVPDADLVIATWWETAFEAVHLPASKGRKYYLVQHHEIHSHLPAHISGASYILPLKKIVVSSWLAKTMREVYSDSNVSLVPNSVDPHLFHADSRERQKQPTVGLMYSATPFKGVDIAIDAVDIVRKTFGELRVIAFGKKRPTYELPLPRNAEFFYSPPQEALRDLYKTCDVYISASRSEGFGLPILEAMACRTPVVSTRTGCAEDVIENGRNGYTVDINDVDGLATGILDILSLSPEKWKEMSEFAHQKAHEYSWQDAGALLEKALVEYNIPSDGSR